MSTRLRDVRLCRRICSFLHRPHETATAYANHHLADFSWSRLYSSKPDDGGNVDFGFRQVPRDAKAGLVGQVFSSVASSYDIMNDLMSGGLHRLWKDRLVESLRPFPGQEHLDVAGGTGDVAFRVLRAVRAAEVGERMAAAAAGRTSSRGRTSPQPPPGASPPSSSSPSAGAETSGSSSSNSSGARSSGVNSGPAGQSSGGGSGAGSSGSSGGPLVPGRVVVCDINPDMLRVGQQKAAAAADLGDESGLSFVEGNAESLPFPDSSFDSYTIAFGIRNVTDRPAALREALRVLKPGGRFLCLEFSQVTQPGLRELYDMYSFAVIPRIGGLVANDAASYQYLVESIRQFPDQETFARLIEEAGFRAVTYENLTGGVVAIHSGFKL
ncbi:2-hexaprenyl-6-methoxy-1,4-benzoquinone methyltransferase [Pleodorina starrii]|uniref:2-methoxy-6-polyprenyl-1,4-benzoquinol methylase, mitochondrial n=1 Tax=Pleodorina starrii TaxID=330485 RepID=A0A9W6BZE2_9CHLO|nr:2-hexaprenyl-6-methoxy-1,4-benzoquinone methyltransferase [Pleodorina starrii]GLC75872.1 2-hexaprenyl-6-methoxy-1 [Pleodorina starrii]